MAEVFEAAAVGGSGISKRILIAGIVASMAMAMWEMILEMVIPGGIGFWSAPVLIAATVMRDLQGVGIPVTFSGNIIGIVVGMMGHMMNSVILAFIFAKWIAPKIGSLGGQIVVGMMYGIVIWIVMWFGILPLIDPVMLKLNMIVFILAHAMWGVALGWINNKFSD